MKKKRTREAMKRELQTKVQEWLNRGRYGLKCTFSDAGTAIEVRVEYLKRLLPRTVDMVAVTEALLAEFSVFMRKLCAELGFKQVGDPCQHCDCVVTCKLLVQPA